MQPLTWHSMFCQIFLKKAPSILYLTIHGIIFSPFEDTDVCKDDHSWCNVVKPDCTLDITKKGCKKYCGMCKQGIITFYVGLL